MSSRSIVSFAILVGIGLIAVMTAAAIASAPPTIVLEKPVHFFTPSGEDVVVGPGTYEVEAEKAGLRLTPKDGKPEEATVIQASPMPHGESLIEPKAQSEHGIGPDEYRITLLLPDRNGLEATGSYSGIRTRGGLANVTYGTTLSANSGSYNTAMGTGALQNNTGGSNNTATGTSALYANTYGSSNTATGVDVLRFNTTGGRNTATGVMALWANTTGSSNTATGVDVLRSNTTGGENTATGHQALLANTTGFLNTAMGGGALSSNTTGRLNTAMGGGALSSNTTGSENTAMGVSALGYNTTGNLNTAVGRNALLGSKGNYNTAVGGDALAANQGEGNTATGFRALMANTTGTFNAATGFSALTANTTGAYNTASGNGALAANLGGSNNTASGAGALRNNSAGNENTALGADALYRNTTGVNSTALGVMALYNATGHNNIAVGNRAGVNQTTGSHNIYVNHEGVTGESNTIRLGTPGTQTQAFIAGIAGVAVGGTPVVVTAYGQLGIQGSSLRYKEDIRDLGTMSEGLHQLRPVSFRYKADTVAGVGDASREFGLIAEEVAEIYPELVGRDADGEIVTVKYHALIPMLLNELQKEHRVNEEQHRQLEALTARVAELEAK